MKSAGVLEELVEYWWNLWNIGGTWWNIGGNWWNIGGIVSIW